MLIYKLGQTINEKIDTMWKISFTNMRKAKRSLNI